MSLQVEIQYKGWLFFKMRKSYENVKLLKEIEMKNELDNGLWEISDLKKFDFDMYLKISDLKDLFNI